MVEGLERYQEEKTYNGAKLVSVMTSEQIEVLKDSVALVPFDCLLNDRRVSEDMVVVWHLNYPLDIYISKEIVQAARKVPKTTMLSYLFAGVELNQEEAHLADMLYDYGQAYGIMQVGTQLYEGAITGDPRAVKMYLEVHRLLNQDDNEEQALKKLMRIEMDI